jgi:hypothetical protein
MPMGRTRLELKDIDFSKKDLSETCLLLATQNQIPVWMAEEIFPHFSVSQKEEIERISSRKGEIDYLSWLYPDLKYKIRYRYSPQKKPDSKRSMFKNRLRTLLRTNLQNNGIQARTLSESMMEFLLGYSIDEIMSHLQGMFKEGMNWENQGLIWHLDHIYPCAMLKYKTAQCKNFKRLWSLSNLRPLCKHENISKGKKVINYGV